MRTHRTLSLLALLLAAPGLGQNAIEPGPRTWSRTYGGPSPWQGLFDLGEVSPGRMVVAGTTASFGGPSQAGWLLQLETATGDVLLERVCRSAAGGVLDGGAVAADGGALFLGRDVIDLFTKHDAWLTRLDPSGDVSWPLGFTRPGFGRHFLFDAEELEDGSWVIVGATGIHDFPPQHGWIVRVSADGTLLWQYEYGGGVTETARAVTPTRDGGFAVAGWTNSSGAGDDDVWVLKVDAAGAIEWQRTFGGFDTDQAQAIVELEDGGLAVAGSTNSLTTSGHAPWLLRLDSAGGLVWQRAVTDIWGDLGDVAVAKDGHLIVVGRAWEAGFASNDLWGAKFDEANGDLLWQRAYAGEVGDYGSVLLPLSGPGFVLGGTWGWGFPEESVWLQKTRGGGRLPGCDLVRTTSFGTANKPVQQADGITIRLTAGAQVQGVTVIVGPSAAEVIERCR